MMLFDPHPPPSPSPPSSPILNPDSSPPGSPDVGYHMLDDDDDDVPHISTQPQGYVDPIGGAYNQTRPPPRYELTRSTSTHITPTRGTPEHTHRSPGTFEWGATSSPIRDRKLLPTPNSDFVQAELSSGRAHIIDADAMSEASPSARVRRRLQFGREVLGQQESDPKKWERIVTDTIERRGNTNDARTIIMFRLVD
jgi:hypothetical protein